MDTSILDNMIIIMSIMIIVININGIEKIQKWKERGNQHLWSLLCANTINKTNYIGQSMFLTAVG